MNSLVVLGLIELICNFLKLSLETLLESFDLLQMVVFLVGQLGLDLLLLLVVLDLQGFEVLNA